MKTNTHQTMPLGDVVVAAFDRAAFFSTDPKEVTRLATKAVMAVLLRAHQTSQPYPLPSPDKPIVTAIPV